MTSATENFERIKREAFERYLLDLTQEFSAEEERDIEERGEVQNYVVRGVELSGSYPKTRLIFSVYERSRKREFESFAGIWSEPTFFDKDGKQRMDAAAMAEFSILWAKGG